ncbi:MAG: condensation domain-containing protein [Faecalibacterium sp.]|nr:condensation domain-containing protein [Ruminococcus sp.]MCM1392779.1 condensation domain-containing protein [Ruminococcus sp.]MCM1486079.1 condensation domain-containing protein [Faecalibacterium sp.]
MIQKTLPNGETVTAYPLATPQQFMLYMSIQYGADYPINNIGSGYYWKGGMDFDVMRESIYEAIERCETMRLRFIPDEQYKVLQYIAPKTEIVIDTLDYSDMPLEQAHKELAKHAVGPVPMFNCELHKIWLVKLADNTNGILFKLQHLAMDAFSTKVFLTDIMEIYLHKTQGRKYPKPMRPYIPTLMTEFAYLKSEQYQIDQQYWFDSLAKTTEPIFTDYMLNSRLKEQRKEHPEHRYADIHGGSPAANVLMFDMSAEETNKIMNMCDENSLSICAVLSMGVRSALSVFNDNEEDVSFKMIVNRRGSIAEKKSGGIRINFFPMRSIITPDKTFKEAVEEIEAVQNEMYQHCSLSFAEMLAVRHKSMPADAKGDSTYDSVGLSYQPLMITPNVDEETAKSAQGIWYNNGASMIPLYITIKHRASDGGLQFIFEYKTDPDPSYDLKVFYKKLRETLLIGAENVDVKVGDILEKTAVTKEEREKA